MISRNLKAIVAFLAPTLTELLVDLEDDVVDWTRLAYALARNLLTAVIVWGVPNTEPPGRRRRVTTISEPA